VDLRMFAFARVSIVQTSSPHQESGSLDHTNGAGAVTSQIQRYLGEPPLAVLFDISTLLSTTELGCYFIYEI
jgi:hypothetical protein